MKFKDYRWRMKTELKDHEFLLYIVKCLLGAALCYLLYYFWPERNFHWSVISVLLVLAPDRVNSLTLPVMRIKANVIGAFYGFLGFILPAPQIVSLLLAVVCTILSCKLLLAENATRSALAALVIVLLMGRGSGGGWGLAVDRMLSVFIGCMVALVLSIVFSLLDRTSSLAPAKE